MAKKVYEPASIGGNMVAEAVDHLRKGRDLLLRSKAIADAVTGAGSSVAALEGDSNFGVPAITGAGSDFYYALTDLKTAADTVTDGAIANLDMGSDE